MGYNTDSFDPAHNQQDEHARGLAACPFCGSRATELSSLFGQQLLTIQFYCHSCHTPFECVKDDDILDAYAARKENQP